MLVLTQSLVAIGKLFSHVSCPAVLAGAIVFCGCNPWATAQTVQDKSPFESNPLATNSGSSAASNLSDQSLSSGPTPPKSILMPNDPNKSFSQTMTQGGIGSETMSGNEDGSEAIGTFASPNPFVRQSTQTGIQSTSQSFGDSNFGKPEPEPRRPITSNGLRGQGSQSAYGAAANAPSANTPSSGPSNFNPIGGAPQNFSSPMKGAPINSAQSSPPPIRQSNQSLQSNNPFRSGTGFQPNRSLQPSQTGQANPPRQFNPIANQQGSNLGNSSMPTGSEFNNRVSGIVNKKAEPKPFASSASSGSQIQSNPIRSDRMVQPTNYVQPPKKIPTELAMQLMSRYLVDSAPSPLPGTPTKLLEMLRQPSSTTDKQKMVSQYWMTYYDWAQLLSKAEHLNWLNSINAPSSPTDQSMLNAAKSVASNKVLAAEIQLGKSQSRLMDFMPNRTSELLPLPSDQPLIQKYKTNYDLYKSHGMIPNRLRGFDSILPKTLQLIANRAETVRLAKSAADTARSALSTRQSSVASVLEAGRIWRAAESDLLASVTTYNRAIADYSLTMTKGAQSPEQIVAMLIAKPRKDRTSVASRPTPSNFPSSSQFGQPKQGQPTRGQSMQGQPQFGQQGTQRPTNFRDQANRNRGTQTPFGQNPQNRPNTPSVTSSQQIQNGNSAANQNRSEFDRLKSRNNGGGQFGQSGQRGQSGQSAQAASQPPTIQGSTKPFNSGQSSASQIGSPPPANPFGSGSSVTNPTGAMNQPTSSNRRFDAPSGFQSPANQPRSANSQFNSSNQFGR